MTITRLRLKAGTVALTSILALGSWSHTSSAQATQTTTPGEVVEVGELPVSDRVSGTGATRRIVYWSQASDGTPALASGALFVPAGTPPPGGWPVLSWEHGTSGLGDQCAPSTSDLADYGPYLSRFVEQGYAVAATDYIGLGTPGVHAYLDGLAEAHAGVDMVRAARAVDPSLSPRWAVIGHSQGGQAALFTAGLATRYAPELDYRGAVALAPGVGAVEAVLASGWPGLPDVFPADVKAYGMYFLRGIKAARADFDLDGYLTPTGRAIMADAEELCLADMTARMKDIGIGEVLAKPMAQGEFASIARAVSQVPVDGYDRPVLIPQGTADTDVPTPLVMTTAAQMRARGADVTLPVYRGANHMAVLDASTGDVEAFLSRVMR